MVVQMKSVLLIFNAENEGLANRLVNPEPDDLIFESVTIKVKRTDIIVLDFVDQSDISVIRSV